MKDKHIHTPGGHSDWKSPPSASARFPPFSHSAELRQGLEGRTGLYRARTAGLNNVSHGSHIRHKEGTVRNTQKASCGTTSATESEKQLQNMSNTIGTNSESHLRVEALRTGGYAASIGYTSQRQRCVGSKRRKEKHARNMQGKHLQLAMVLCMVLGMVLGMLLGMVLGMVLAMILGMVLAMV